MKRVYLILGVVLIVAGIAGLIHPTISYHTREQVVKLGPIEANVEQEKERQIPVVASVAVLLVGIVLLVAGSRNK